MGIVSHFFDESVFVQLSWRMNFCCVCYIEIIKALLTHTHTLTNTNTHTRSHTYAHTLTHIRTHAHTQLLRRREAHKDLLSMLSVEKWDNSLRVYGSRTDKPQTSGGMMTHLSNTGHILHGPNSPYRVSRRPQRPLSAPPVMRRSNSTVAAKLLQRDTSRDY